MGRTPSGRGWGGSGLRRGGGVRRGHELEVEDESVDAWARFVSDDAGEEAGTRPANGGAGLRGNDHLGRAGGKQRKRVGWGEAG